MALQDPFFARSDGRRIEGRPARRGELILAFVLALALALPFVDKAVTQDGWAYLTIGAMAAEQSEGLIERRTLYQGAPITVGQGMLHGPLWIALLAGCEVLGGEHSLVLARLLSALLLGLLALSTTSLAARLGAPPLATGLALALAPGPLLLAGTAMTDLPMLALFVAALAAAVAAAQRDSIPLAVLAGVLAAAAALTRYFGLSILPLLAVQPLLFGRLRLRAFVPLAVASVLVAAWLVYSRAAYGALDTERGLAALEGLEVRPWFALLAAICGLGGMAAGWVFAGLARPRRLLRAVLGDPLLLFLVLGALSVGVWLAIDAASLRGLRPAGPNAALQHGMLLFGAVLCAAGLLPWLDVGAWRRGGLANWRAVRGSDAWLGLWLLGSVVAAVLFVPFGAARYVLPALAPAVLLCGLFTARRLGSGAARWGLGASAVLGLACAVADENASGAYQRYARTIGERRAPGGPWSETGLWVWGELGLRWYLEREAGAFPLPRFSEEPVAGDRILRSALCTASVDDGRAGTYPLAAGLIPRMYAEDHEIWHDGWPLRVHNPYAGAGFYHADAGILPYAFSRARLDEVQTWLVKEPSALLETFDGARVEELSSARLSGGNVHVERFAVREDLPSYPAVKFVFPARVTWTGVPVPPDRPFLCAHLGQSLRIQRDDIETPGAVARILVDGEPVFECGLDAARRAGDRRWFPASPDLSPWAGREVTVTFEVVYPAHFDPAVEGLEPATLVGFADPRFSSEPLPRGGDRGGAGVTADSPGAPRQRPRRLSRGRRAAVRTMETACRLLGGRAWYRRAFLAPGRFRLRRESVVVPGLPPDLVGFRIAHLSDLHAGPFLGPGDLAHVVDVVHAVRADLVCITGDLITHRWDEALALVPDLGRLRAPHGVCAVFGNHDYRGRREGGIAAAFAAAGVRLLRNRSWRLRRGAGVLAVVGVEDLEEARVIDLAAARADLMPGDVQLVLCHNPLGAPHLAGEGVAAVLSGHTHGHQIDLPLLRAAAPRHPGDRVDVAGTACITSRGLGVIGVPLRLFAPPEVVLIELRDRPGSAA